MTTQITRKGETQWRTQEMKTLQPLPYTLGTDAHKMVGRLGGEYTIKYDPELYVWRVFYQMEFNGKQHVIAMVFEYYTCMSSKLLDVLLQRVYAAMSELFY